MRKANFGHSHALYFCYLLLSSSDFAFREAWMHLPDDFSIKYEAMCLPPPIVAYLNGDGKKEILVATQDAKIQILEPHSEWMKDSIMLAYRES